jgi:hypothetical protein
MSKIFIQIAAYRDTELLPTLHNLLSNSKYPDNLSFGLVWQHDKNDAWDNLDPYIHDKRFRIMDVPYYQSGGMGWARSKTQSLYDGEDYTLQIDSHMRFAKNWDKSLLQMMNYLHKISNKPMLTGYAFQYDPQNDKSLQDVPSTLTPLGFKKNGILFFKSFANRKNQYFKPYRARLVGGHYLLTLGKHCQEYIYDPNLYYAGDEWTLSVRSYTLGYDLFHPHKNVLWHYYKRSSNNKHWTDYAKEVIDPKEDYNIKRIQQMMGQNNHGIDLEMYGLGSSRSIEDYENYSGIYIKDKKILTEAMLGIEPPVTSSRNFIKKFKVKINNHPQQFIVNFHKNKSLDKIKLDLISLDTNIIYSQQITIEDIIKQPVLELEYTGEEKPMGYKLECYHSNDTEPRIKVYKDIEPETQWI